MGRSSLNTLRTGAGRLTLLFFFLFGLPFAGGGVWVGSQVIKTIVAYEAAKRWPQTDATVLATELKTNSDGDGTTYQVTCSYTYTWEGREYTGRQVGLSTGPDNIGDWHRKTYRRLRAAQVEGGPVPCYVDPANPQQAVLDRSLRYMLLLMMSIFPATFVPVGVLLSGMGLVGLLGRRREALTHPDEPWLDKPEWAAGVIPAGLGVTTNVLAATAGWWNLVWLPSYVYAPNEILARGNRWALFVLIPLLIGWALARGALRTIRGYRRYGATRLELATVPGVIGGRFAGRLVLPGGPDMPSMLTVKLACTQQVTRRSGGESETRTNTLWEESRELPVLGVTFGQEQLAVPVEFTLPTTGQETTAPGDTSPITWKLHVSSLDDPRLKLEYEVPVYRTAESPELPADTPAEPLVAAALEHDEPPPGSRIVQERLISGERLLTIARFPGLGPWLKLSIMGIIFVAGGGIAGYLAPRHTCFLYPFAVFFGGIGLLICFMALSALGTDRITLNAQGLVFGRRRFGRESSTPVAAGEVTAVHYKETSSIGSTSFHSITLHRPTGRKLTIAGMVKGLEPAVWLALQVSRHLGVGDPVLDERLRDRADRLRKDRR